LCGGNLSAATQTTINNYVTNNSNGTVSGVSTGYPCPVTVSTALPFAVGSTMNVTISGTTGGAFLTQPIGGVSTSINASFVATVTGANTFTVPIDCTSAPAVTSAIYTTNTFNPTISSIGQTSPCTVNVASTLNLAPGSTASVTISGVTGGTFTGGPINGTYSVTVTSPTSFTVTGVNCTSATGIVLTRATWGSATLMPNQTMRDRVRAILQLILTSAEYSIQK
jgi:expansin (peptidoglycan-binding protein)